MNAASSEFNEYVLFSMHENHLLDERTFQKELRGKQVDYVECLVRGKSVQLKPEERNRQLWLSHLIEWTCPVFVPPRVLV